MSTAYLSKLKEKTAEIQNEDMRNLYKGFLSIREMTFSMLLKVPEEKLNYKPNPKEMTQDLRECFAELPRVQLSLVKAFQTGKRAMGQGHLALSDKPAKEEIIAAFEKVDNDLLDVLRNKDFNPQMEVVWLDKAGNEKWKTTAYLMFVGFRNHENMHLGMIRRDFDGIDIEPSDEYVKYWYGK